jgi:hypothetical protein
MEKSPMNGGGDNTQGFSGPCQAAQILVSNNEYYVVTNANIPVNRTLDWRGKLEGDAGTDNLKDFCFWSRNNVT